MPQEGLIFRALIASPSDCTQERKIIPEVIRAWNVVHSIDKAAIVEPVLWETHSFPTLGGHPQEILNKQLIQDCDLVIGAFWTRLGTPTGKAESGTAEELELFRDKGKPVLLYFSNAPVLPDSIDQEQYNALVKYKKSLKDTSLFFSYESLAEFRDLLQRHFASNMINLLSKFEQRDNESFPSIENKVKVDPHIQQLTEFLSQYETFIRFLDAEWKAERDSKPNGTEDGKYILNSAADEIVHFKSMITEDSTGISDEFANILKKLKSLQRHNTYMDGGVSFQAFWDSGDDVIASLKDIGSKLHELIFKAQQGTENDTQ